MSKPFNFGAEPFQGFTEFDEFESLDEFDEFGEEEFGSLETFETDFDLVTEEERRGGGARGGRPALRSPGRRPMTRAGRPGIRGGRRPPGRPWRPPRPSPRLSRPPRPRRPGVFDRYSRFSIPQLPDDMRLSDGACPSVGRYGNWFRSGDQLIILLEEDAALLDQGATAAGASNGASGAPYNGGPEAPPEAAPEAPSEGGSDGPTEGTQGELAGRGGLSRRRLSLIQQALNQLQGLRLPAYGLSNPPTRSALRGYQQQKGLIPHGQPDYETELALASDIASSQRNYEIEFVGGDPCHRQVL